MQQVDVAFLDATFFDGNELPNRKLSEIPHPTVRETMEQAASWPLSVRQKVYLIHFNHTNPLLQMDSPAYQEVRQFGFRIARVGDRVAL
jgi:pyrroloquinoline quinone biosynthesis protein B